MAGAGKPQQRANQQRWQMRPNLRRLVRENRALSNRLNFIYNHLILKHYFSVTVFRD
jgi:hypothetical protein